MGRVVFLGTAHSIADDHHNNTHLVIQEGDRAIMVDCVGYPLLHLRRAIVVVAGEALPRDMAHRIVGLAQAQPGDLFGTLKNVRPGSRALRVVIDQVQP